MSLLARQRALICALTLTSGLSAATPGHLAAGSDDEPVRERMFHRGMVVSCPRGGQIWGSAEMATALQQLDGLGVEWIAIHPYAGVRRDGSVRSWRSADADYLQRANEMVRQVGMKFFWKPHLGYWGSFDWRGDIEFSNEEEWERFFAGYRSFILDHARFAESIGAEIFAVGVELEKTTHRREWLEILSAVRDIYTGQLTYAANWDRLDRVPFWDRLDLIGVHAYFPLSDSPHPEDGELLAAWDEPLEALAGISADAGGLPILLAEIGYNRSSKAASEPWSYAMTDSDEARELRARLIETAIRRLEIEPLIAGMFWWKWIPGPLGHDRDFSMKDSEAVEVLSRRWGSAASAIGSCGR